VWLCVSAGLTSSAMMLGNGRVTGISGIVNGAVFTRGVDTAWKSSFLSEFARSVCQSHRCVT
jgi:hypothetical protein